jgi:hypothetical protein
MRGLLMAFLAFDFPGFGTPASAGHEPLRARSTKTTAKTTARTV